MIAVNPLRCHTLNLRSLICATKLVPTTTSRRLLRDRAGLNSIRSSSTMHCWKINDSLDNPIVASIASKLCYTETKVPTLSSPSDVLIKVHSTSINPLDVRMCYGYGRRLLDLLDWATNFEVRITNDRYPLTLGRDFSGEVIAVGPCVKNLKPGDLVFGAVEPQKSGAHAEYVITSSKCLTKKPSNLSHNEAASVPFVALTAYSALCTFGQLERNKCDGKQVLVIGGSGGVGSFAIQLLKLWGASVTSTCSEEKTGWLEDTLLVDRALNYNDLSQLESLNGRFDFVLDCGVYEKTTLRHEDVLENSLKFLKPNQCSVYVTLSPPILSNIDNHGLIFGSAETLMQAISDTVRGVRNLNSARWAFFLPNRSALEYIANLYEEEAISPQVDSVFNFDLLPKAYEKLLSGQTKGKIVVDVNNPEGFKSSESTGTESTTTAKA